jgi:hypothetical protein
MLQKNLIKGSEIYHAYSNSLHSVIVEKKDIFLSYEFTKEEALKTYKKGNQETYLLDEIKSRTLKMHKERVYCMRFLRPEIDIQKIFVKIEVFEDIQSDAFMKRIDIIEYCLEEKGYPEVPDESIDTLCSGMKGKDGKWLKGKIEGQ